MILLKKNLKYIFLLGISLFFFFVSTNIIFAEAIVIYDVDDLQAMNDDLTADYVLGNDIDASAAADFQPIGQYYNSFMGTFDGAGHKITNLRISTTNTPATALFGSTNLSTIQNVGLVDVLIDSDGEGTDYFTAGLIGKADSTTVSNCYITGSVYSSYGGNTGGLIAKLYNSTLTNVYSTASVSGTGNVGGLVGSIRNTNIANGYSTGNVTNPGSCGTMCTLGGLVGFIRSSNSGYTIKNSFATGVITDNNGNYSVGGLIGSLNPFEEYVADIDVTFPGAGNYTFTNLAWWTGNGATYVYKDMDGVWYSLLADNGWGTDSANIEDFYSLAHPVYSQLVDDFWDFETIWQVPSADFPHLQSEIVIDEATVLMTVSRQGEQVATTTIPTVTPNNIGGAFTFIRSSGSADITSITMKQAGSLPADTYITNFELYYKAEDICSTTKPEDAALFGADGVFVGNIATTTGTMTVGTVNVCLYPVYDLENLEGQSSEMLLGDSINFEISQASDVVVSLGLISMNAPVNIHGSTIIEDENITDSLLSLRMDDPLLDPTVFYLKDDAVWKRQGTSTAPVRLTNSNLKVHSLVFASLTGLHSAGVVRIEITMSNMDPNQEGTFLNVTRTYKTTATVKAWSKNVNETDTISVIYNGNTSDGGSAPVDSIAHTVGSTVTVLGVGSLTKTGYTFVGWNTAVDGSGTDYNANDTFVIGITGVTLYAKWTANSYTVTYNNQSATVNSLPTSQTVTSPATTVLDNGGLCLYLRWKRYELC